MANEQDIYSFVMDVKGEEAIEELDRQWARMSATAKAAAIPVGELTAAVDLNAAALEALYGDVARDTGAILAFAEAEEKARAKTYEFADAEKAATRSAADLAAAQGSATRAQADAQARAAEAQARVSRAQMEAQLASYSATRSINTQALSLADLRTGLSAVEAQGVAAAWTMGRGGNFGLALLEGSRALEDLQYGIGGVLNNIPTLVMAMGGAGGLAGLVSVVAVGANQLYKNWDSVATLWGGGATETEAKRMERLEQSTHRTAEETKELNKHLENKAALAKLGATPDEGRSAQAKDLTEAIGKVGGHQALFDVRNAVRERDAEQPGNPTEKDNPEEYRALQARRDTEVAALIDAAQKGQADAIAAINELLNGTKSGQGSKLGQAYKGTLIKAAPDEDPDKARRRRSADWDAQDRAQAAKAEASAKEDEEFAKFLLGEGTKEKQAREKAEQERKAATDQGVARYGGAFSGLQGAMAEGEASGIDPAQVDRKLSLEVEKMLSDSDVPEAIRAGVAGAIVGSWRKKLADKQFFASIPGAQPAEGDGPWQAPARARAQMPAPAPAAARAGIAPRPAAKKKLPKGIKATPKSIRLGDRKPAARKAAADRADREPLSPEQAAFRDMKRGAKGPAVDPSSIKPFAAASLLEGQQAIQETQAASAGTTANLVAVVGQVQRKADALIDQLRRANDQLRENSRPGLQRGR